MIGFLNVVVHLDSQTRKLVNGFSTYKFIIPPKEFRELAVIIKEVLKNCVKDILWLDNLPHNPPPYCIDRRDRLHMFGDIGYSCFA